MTVSNMYSGAQENQAEKVEKISPFLQAIEELAELGLHPIPLKPDCYPRITSWRKLIHRQPDSLLRNIWNKNWPDAGVGVVYGSPARDDNIVVGIDFADATETEIESLHSCLPESNMIVSDAKSAVRFYQAHISMHPRIYKIGERVVLRVHGAGGYAAVPNTSGFEWTKGPTEAGELIELTNEHQVALQDALRGLGASSHKDDTAHSADAAQVAGASSELTDGGGDWLPNDDLGDASLEAPGATELPDRLTRIPGLVGRITDWVAKTARNPNRVLALGVAIAVVNTLCGRRDAGPTKTGLSLYILLLGPTGIGKQHGLTQVYRLLEAAGARSLLGPGEFGSAPAMSRNLTERPLSLCPQDEFGSFLQRILGKRAGGHERSIAKDLRSAWGTNYGVMQTTDYLGNPGKVVHAPAMTIYGVSTPQEFYSALGGADLENGTLNRFLLLSTSAPVVEIEPELDDSIVPDDIAQDLSAMYLYGRALSLSQRLSSMPRPTSHDVPVTPRVVPWMDEAAKAVYEELKTTINTARIERPADESFFARTAEMAQRIATGIALGQDWENPAVSVSDIETARDIALHSARRMAVEAGDRMQPDTVDGMWSKVEARLKRSGGYMSHRALSNYLKIGSRPMADLVKSMEEAGRVRNAKVAQARGGHPVRSIILVDRKKKT